MADSTTGYKSTLLERVLSQKHLNHTSNKCLWRASVYFFLSLAMVFELKFSPITEYFSWRHPYIWYTELVLTIVFSVSTLTDLVVYLFSKMSTSAIPLTPKQKALMGVTPHDQSFTSPPSYGRVSQSSAFNSPTITHRASYSNLSVAHTPKSQTPSPVKSNSFTTVSPVSFNVSPGGSFLAASRPGSGLSMTSNVISPDSRSDMSGLRSRGSSYRQSPAVADSFIADQRSLSQFLREEEEKEEKRIASESANTSNISYWTINRTATDYAPVMRKYQYQVACRSPQSSTSTNDDNSDHTAKSSSSQVWSKLDILEVQLDRWIGNIRYWLNQTIFVRLVNEIDSVNNDLMRIGCSDMMIGDVSTSSLKQIAVTKIQHVPSLNTIIPYLEVSSHQQYLVNRIRELGKGGCMSEYDWNGGGKYKGKVWADHLPTDAAIVAHAFCSYFDARLPANPRYTDGRVFTSVHFIKTPEKPAPSKSSLCLYQTKVNPPHYNVVIGEDIWDIPKGRNNLFYALIVFLHHIKHKQHGMLGPINLGMSGMNIMWTLED